MLCFLLCLIFLPQLDNLLRLLYNNQLRMRIHHLQPPRFLVRETLFRMRYHRLQRESIVHNYNHHLRHEKIVHNYNHHLRHENNHHRYYLDLQRVNYLQMWYHHLRRENISQTIENLIPQRVSNHPKTYHYTPQHVNHDHRSPYNNLQSEILLLLLYLPN